MFVISNHQGTERNNLNLTLPVQTDTRSIVHSDQPFFYIYVTVMSKYVINFEFYSSLQLVLIHILKLTNGNNMEIPGIRQL